MHKNCIFKNINFASFILLKIVTVELQSIFILPYGPDFLNELSEQKFSLKKKTEFD